MNEFYHEWHPGWNLGNTLDALGSETSWGNPLTTKELIEHIAAQGFKSIRIPITWGHRMGPEPNYIIHKSFMSRVEEIVNWSLDAGLRVMINLHHDTEWIFNMASDPQVLPRFEAAWHQIATHFQDYPHTLIFEAINEPRFSHDWNEDRPNYFAMAQQLNTSFYNIVRGMEGNNKTRPLVLTTLTSSPAQSRINELAKTIEQLNDDQIIATVHYYGDWPFSVNIAGNYRFNNQNENHIVNSLDAVYNAFVTKGIPVIIGEYGLLGFDTSYNTIQRGEILKYFEFLSHHARERHIPLMLWDNGQHLDRNQLTWNDPSLYRMVIADSRSSTSELDTIYIKASEQLTAKSITLNFNNNSLVDIYHGESELVPGEDYRLQNDILTLQASFLRRILKDEYGVNAVLTLEFTDGNPWQINIVYYDTPVLKASQGMLNYYLPVEFNGTHLATMEAIYPKGGNAGPQNWTSFKQSHEDFYPRYEQNLIILTTRFMNELRDGEVLLRFHFWSGEILEYMIDKSGSSWAGRPL